MPRPQTTLLAAALLAGTGGVAVAQQDNTTGATTGTAQQPSGPAERPGATSPGAARSLNNSNPASGATLPGGIGTPPAAAPGAPETTAPAPQQR